MVHIIRKVLHPVRRCIIDRRIPVVESVSRIREAIRLTSQRLRLVVMRPGPAVVTDPKVDMHCLHNNRLSNIIRHRHQHSSRRVIEENFEFGSLAPKTRLDALLKK